jgi:hypothetical protein
MEVSRKMKNLIKKIWLFLAGDKSTGRNPTNSEQETYCEMVRREKREEKMREQEKKPRQGGWVC